MAMREGQRGKLLMLYRVLWQETDEEHPLSAPALAARLTELGIPAERKSIYDDIDTLSRMGVDIVLLPRSGYFLAERSFQLPELKLLVDAVQSSRFISQQDRRSLIAKLEGQASRHQAQSLHRQVYVAGQDASVNRTVYYTIDTIHAAIGADRQISFQYFDYSPERERILRHGGALYRVSPFLLLRNDSFYYLIAYDGGHGELRHYRVDRMLRLSRLRAKRRGKALFEGLDLERYTEQHFSMFRGQQQDVTLRCENRFSGVMIDRFGQEISMAPEAEGYFTLTIRLSVSEQFYGWVLGLGTGVTILSPAPVREGLRDYLQRQLSLYGGSQAIPGPPTPPTGSAPRPQPGKAASPSRRPVSAPQGFPPEGGRQG